MELYVSGVITQAAIELGIGVMVIIAAAVIFVVAHIAYSWFARLITDRSERAEYRRAIADVERLKAQSGATYSEEHGWQYSD